MDFLAAAAVLVAAYGYGSVLTAPRLLKRPPGLLGRATAFGAGFAVLGLAAFTLGYSGAFESAALDPIVLTGTVLGLPPTFRDLMSLRHRWSTAGRERWLLAGVAVVLVAEAVLASAPPTSGDAVAYLLTAPKLWLASGRISAVWWDYLTAQPFSQEMNYAYAQALAGGRAAMIVGAGLAAFSSVCVYGLARELCSRTVAAVAAALWVWQGIFLWEATGAFVELTVAAFVALAAWHLAVLARTRSLSHAAWAGFAVGVAASCKVHALVVLPLVAGACVLAAPRRRRLRALLAFAAPLAVALPWYVKNWIVTGNPIYPLLFGGRYWNTAVQHDFDQGQSIYGVHGIWRLPIIPLEFLIAHGRFERGYAFGPLLFVLAPVGLYMFRRQWWARIFGVAGVAYSLVWFEQMDQITRYILPILPLAAVLAAAALVTLARGSRRTRAVAGISVAATIVPFVAMFGLFTWQVAPGALGLEAQGPFVQRLTGTYDAFQWLDRNLGPGRVAITERNLYWLDHPYVRYTIPLFFDGQPTAEVVDRFRSYDVRYLAVYDSDIPAELAPIRNQFHLIARVAAPIVTSRTLGRSSTGRTLTVYVWRPPSA